MTTSRVPRRRHLCPRRTYRPSIDCRSTVVPRAPRLLPNRAAQKLVGHKCEDECVEGEAPSMRDARSTTPTGSGRAHHVNQPVQELQSTPIDGLLAEQRNEHLHTRVAQAVAPARGTFTTHTHSLNAGGSTSARCRPHHPVAIKNASKADGKEDEWARSERRRSGVVGARRSG